MDNPDVSGVKQIYPQKDNVLKFMRSKIKDFFIAGITDREKMDKTPYN